MQTHHSHHFQFKRKGIHLKPPKASISDYLSCFWQTKKWWNENKNKNKKGIIIHQLHLTIIIDNLVRVNNFIIVLPKTPLFTPQYINDWMYICILYGHISYHNNNNNNDDDDNKTKFNIVTKCRHTIIINNNNEYEWGWAKVFVVFASIKFDNFVHCC